MKISVIVPFLNEEKYIEKCIKSLINQDIPKKDYELIFVDNGSTDGSVEIVKKYKDVKLLFEKVRNVYAARNLGLEYAKGELIAFTDADCEVNSSWLKEIVTAFNDKKVGLVLGKRVFPTRKLGLGAIEDYENSKIKYIIDKKLREYMFGFTNNMATRMKLFEEIGKFKLLKVNGDTEWVQRLMCNEKMWESRYLPGMKIVHMEIENIGNWYRKLIIYGKENAKLRMWERQYKTLEITKNWGILLSDRDKIVNTQILTVLVVLMMGFMSYKLGVVSKYFS